MKCIVCGKVIGNEYIEIGYVGKENHQICPDRIISCPCCETMIADPMLTEHELSQLYENSEYWGRDQPVALDAKKTPVPFALAKARFQMIEKFIETPEKLTVLDIGAGHGCLGIQFAFQLGSRIQTYVAQEPDPFMRQTQLLTWDKFGFSCELKTIASLDETVDKFDVIVISHVLEHVSQPKFLLSSAIQRLKNGGILFVEVPHQDQFFKKDVFPHLLFFSAKGLDILLNRCGVKVEEVAIYGKNREISPMRSNPSRFQTFYEKILWKLSRFLPDKILVNAYMMHYGVNKRHPKGTWLRAVARK